MQVGGVCWLLYCMTFGLGGSLILWLGCFVWTGGFMVAFLEWWGGICLVGFGLWFDCGFGLGWLV